MAKSGRSEDLPYSQKKLPVNNGLGIVFLRCTTRKKNGKEHRYWNVVKNRRVAGGQVIQRQALYLGEINDNQREVWRKSIQVFEDGRSAPQTVLGTGREPTRR